MVSHCLEARPALFPGLTCMQEYDASFVKEPSNHKQGPSQLFAKPWPSNTLTISPPSTSISFLRLCPMFWELERQFSNPSRSTDKGKGVGGGGVRLQAANKHWLLAVVAEQDQDKMQALFLAQTQIKNEKESCHSSRRHTAPCTAT